MTEQHRHDAMTGEVIVLPETAEAELAATEVVTEASVQIAKIEADKEITLAKIERGLAVELADTELEVLRAENAVLKEQLAAFMPAPEPEPEPVVIVQGDDAAPELDDTQSLPEPEPMDEPAPKSRKPVGLGMW